MKFAVHQPNFCPWIGYFAKMNAVDIFVILDDVQMPMGRSYVSRTKISGGMQGTWLSVSVNKDTGANIKDILLSTTNPKWKSKHLNLLKDRYRGHAFYSELMPEIEKLYSQDDELLLDFNMKFIKFIADAININTKIRFSSAMNISSKSDERIADIGVKIGAKEYCSGVGGNNYQTKEIYTRKGLSLSIMNINSPSDEISNIGFSILDNLMEVGPKCVKTFIDKLQPQYP